MKLRNFLTAATIALVFGLMASLHLYPDTIITMFADDSTVFMALRAGIVVMLLSLLMTNPPRSQALRLLIGTWSVALIALTSHLFLNYQLLLLDAILFVEVAIIFGVEALEAKRVIPVNKHYSPPRRIKVLSM